MTNRSEYPRVLLISNSTLYGSGYLDHAKGEIRRVLDDVLKGSSGARIFRKGLEPVETLPGDCLKNFVNGKAVL